MKLKEKRRIGSKVQKLYDKPLTPAERVLSHEGISKEVKAKVRRINARIDALALADEVAVLQAKVLALAEDLRQQRKAKEVAG